MAWRRGVAFAIPSEGLEHRRDQTPRETDGDAVDRLVRAVEVVRGGVADVVLVPEREPLVAPDRRRLPDLPVGHLGRHRDGIAAGLGVSGRPREAERRLEVAGDLPVHHRVHPRLLLHHGEVPALLQLLDHLERDLLVQVAVPRPVLEERHADPLDRRVRGDPLAHERISASGEATRGEQEYGGYAFVSSQSSSIWPFTCRHRSTTLTSRPGTTTTFTTCLPFTCEATSARASSFTFSSGVPAAIMIRPLTFPFTCTASSTASSRAASSSKAGQAARTSPPWCPSFSHISSHTWGVKGFRSSTSVSTASRSTARPGPEARSGSSR